MDKTDVLIKYARSEDEKNKIYNFRYKVYIDEMGKSIAEADHENRFIKDEFDESAVLLYAEADGEVVATLRLNMGGDVDFSQYWRDVYKLNKFISYPKDVISMSSKFMVDKEWRGSSALGMLLMEGYKFSKAKGVKFDFCNCSPHLVEFYEHLGYRRYCDGFMDEDTGYHIPVVFVLDDIEHLKKVRSPFYRAVRHLAKDADRSTKEWFEDKFSEHHGFINRRLVSTDEFWLLLQRKLSGSLSSRSALFKNMDDEDIQKFIGMSTTLSCKSGDVVIRPGDVGAEMFVVLSGVVDVKSSLDDEAISLAVLNKGQIFGEMAFVSKAPRTAAVVAKSDVELLVLTQALFNKVMKTQPEITARILLNLSNILSQRLHSSTQNWTNKNT